MKFAFIVPRYFESIAGGAETLCGEFAYHLSQRGDECEIWTTTAKDNRTWENFYEPKTEIVKGMTVRRFSVSDRSLDVWIPLQMKLSDGFPLTIEEELTYYQESVISKDLFDWIKKNGENFDALFFGPYLFGTTFWGAQIHPEKSILIPCLHDESNAYMNVMRSLFTRVRGVLFNADEERELSERLFGEKPGGVVGMGFSTPEDVKSTSDQNENPNPYILYLGRKETGKNLHVLIDHFIALKNYQKEHKKTVLSALRLIIAGGGSIDDVHRASAWQRGDIIDEGHISEERKQELLKGAVCLVQPSTNESFGIVLMEAWQAGTAVVVPAQCPVTKGHVMKSQGGLYYSELSDFIGIIETLVKEKELRVRLGEAGKRYVAEEYSWDSVLRRFDSALCNAGIIP